MDGFKNSTKTQYMKGGSVGERKIGRVMEEFTKGKLHSGSKEGPKVKSTKQAVAIALNEARAAGAKIPRVKKAMGGSVSNPPVRPVVNPNPPSGPRQRRFGSGPNDGGGPTPPTVPGRVKTPMSPPARPMGVEPKPRRISTPEPKLSIADRATRAMANSPEGVVVKAPTADKDNRPKLSLADRLPVRPNTVLTGTEPIKKATGGAAKKGVPAHSSKPMIGRKSGGLSVMPKGKC